MLSRDRRMRRQTDFQRALRGRRAGRATVVASLVGPAADAADEPARVGFIVSKAVGGATTRNRVRRRLRHLVAARLDQLPAGSLLVVRALPAAAQAPRTALSTDLDRVVRRLLVPATPRKHG